MRCTENYESEIILLMRNDDTGKEFTSLSHSNVLFAYWLQEMFDPHPFAAPEGFLQHNLLYNATH